MEELEVIFGSVSLKCQQHKITPVLNGIPTATLRFSKDDFLKPGVINYLDEVLINSVRSQSRVFTGNIISIKSEPNNEVVIYLASGIEIKETGVKHLRTINVDHREAFYSLSRQAGFSKDQLKISGLDDSDKEMIAFVPFKGFVVENDEMVGEVQFISSKSLQEKFPQVEQSESLSELFNADGWISFRFRAAHFFEAEEVAIEKADAFLSVYSGLLQYGYSQFDGAFIEWERTRESINLLRQNHIWLVMLRQGASWLRDVSVYKPNQTTLKPNIGLDIKTIIDANEDFQLPLLIWNRFRDSEDYYVVTIGLWQVIELFSSGDKLPKRFTEDELDDLSSRAVAHLADKQEQKFVRDAIKRLNERTLMEKFNKHLENIGLVVSKRDRHLLRKFRDIRNAIEHGRKPIEPSVQEIKRVKALTNRVILASLKQPGEKIEVQAPMKLLTREQIDSSVAILQTLASAISLQIIQYLYTSMKPGAESEIFQALYPAASSITVGDVIDINRVVKHLVDLKQVGILLGDKGQMTTDRRYESIFSFNPNMPELAQDILLVLWPDWYKSSGRNL